MNAGAFFLSLKVLYSATEDLLMQFFREAKILLGVPLSLYTSFSTSTGCDSTKNIDKKKNTQGNKAQAPLYQIML